MEEVKSNFNEIYDFECRDVSKLEALYAGIAPSGFPPKEINRIFPLLNSLTQGKSVSTETLKAELKHVVLKENEFLLLAFSELTVT